MLASPECHGGQSSGSQAVGVEAAIDARQQRLAADDAGNRFAGRCDGGLTRSEAE
jgi:hypothetical protein